MPASRAIPALVALAALAGCAVGSSSSQANDARALTDPLQQASSAVATATIAVDLLGDGRATPTVTDTALRDQVAVLDQAAFSVTTLVPTDRTTAGWQQDALATVAQAQGSVVAARSWANGAGSRQQAVEDALEASARRLDELTAQLEGDS
jgi:hypothetical protein